MPVVFLYKNVRNGLTVADIIFGAGDEARTRYLHLGKVALYQMSYTRMTKSIIARFLDLSTLFSKVFTT